MSCLKANRDVSWLSFSGELPHGCVSPSTKVMKSIAAKPAIATSRIRELGQLGFALILIPAARSSARVIASAGAGSERIFSTARRSDSGNSPFSD
jgi:hypothetical protein